MTARERVLQGYGGDPPRCAWCGTTEGPFEIDHVEGQGNQHRTTLTKKIEYWLCDQYEQTGSWPPLVQVLCAARCHAIKSGRRRMPVAKDTQRVTIAFPEEKAKALEQLAQGPLYEGSKSKLLEVAFDRFLEAQAGDLALAGMQQQLSSLQSTLLQAIQTQAAVQASQGETAPHRQLVGISERLATLDTRLAGVDNELGRLHRRLGDLVPPMAPPPPPEPRWRMVLRVLFGGAQ